MKKTETIVVKTEEIHKNYCDFCGKLIYDSDPKFFTANKNGEVLEEGGKTAFLSVCIGSSVGWNGELSEQSAAVKHAVNMSKGFDCCFDCFTGKISDWLESQKIKPTV